MRTLDVHASLSAMLLVAGLAAVAAANGGYFPTSWGWSGVVCGWVLALALLGERASLAPREWAFVGVLAIYCSLGALSAIWSTSATSSLLESERGLVVVLAVGSVLLLVRGVAMPLFCAALVGAATAISIYALATRLFPDRLGTFDPVAGYRLATPVGYWNALGLFAALGTLLALGISARLRPAARASAAAALLALVPTIYFTFSRGALLGLAIALTATVLLDPRRLQLLATVAALAPAPTIAVIVGSQSPALTHQTSRLAAAARDGHRLALLVVLLALANAAIALLLTRTERRFVVGTSTRRMLHVSLAIGALVAVVAAVAAAGGPVRLVHRGYDAFVSPPPAISGNLNAHLLSFSGNRRADLFRAAVNDWKAHPILGSGAGSYEQYWLQHRPIGLKVRDAHSLYLETLAELGPIGLLLLVIVLATPLAALPRARHHSLVPALAGAYVAFLAHAGIDWDWEVLAVTLAGLFCGAGILIAARTGEERPLSERARVGGITAVLALLVVAFVGLVGNIELSRAGTAARAGKWQTAARDARRARTWAPWSSQPWQQLGEAQLGLGEQRAAQASFRGAIAKSPDDWSLWFDLARASSGKARVAALAQAHRLNPLSPEVAEFENELATQGSIGVVDK